jgi:hypothetical protein
MKQLHQEAFLNALDRVSDACLEGDYDTAMRHLEVAHILGQYFTLPHLRVHWLMFLVACARRRPADAIGQLIRLALGVLGNAVGVLPTGNPGSSDVNMFRKHPIPLELAAIMESDRA